MKVIKQFTAIQLGTKTVNDEVILDLSYGFIKGPYYSRERPEQIFETEEEATSYAYKKDKWATWLILPIVSFDNF